MANMFAINQLNLKKLAPSSTRNFSKSLTVVSELKSEQARN